MRLIFHILVAFLLTACASTKTAVQTERVEQMQTERVEQRTEQVQTERTEQTERVKVTEVVEHITEEVQPPIAADTLKPTPQPTITRKTERTIRTVEGEKKAVEELTETASSEQVEQAEERSTSEVAEVQTEVEDSTPKNLRWLGIIALCAFGIYLLTFIKKFIK